MDDLNITGDTGSKDFNQILTDGSRQIADYASFLNQELKELEIIILMLRKWLS